MRYGWATRRLKRTWKLLLRAGTRRDVLSYLFDNTSGIARDAIGQAAR